jgi:hypothetical protein
MRRRFLCLPVDLPDDPRLISLAAALRCDHVDAYLVRLWSWAVRQSPDGMVGVYDDAVIAHACRWPGAPAEFVSALRDSGWLVGESLADWTDLYRVESDRAATAERVRKHRAAKRSKACNVTVAEFSLSSNSKISNSEISDLSKGEIPKRGIPDAPQQAQQAPARDRSRLGPMDARWWESDPSILRAHLLAMRGPGELLALPDPDGPGSVLECLRLRYPAWDGADGRPTVEERSESTWDALRARVEKRSADPLRAIGAWRQWIGDRHDQAAQRLRRASGGSDDPSALASRFAGVFRPLES